MARRKRKKRKGIDISGFPGSASIRGNEGTLLRFMSQRGKDPSVPDISGTDLGGNATRSILGTNAGGSATRGVPDIGGGGATVRERGRTVNIGAAAGDPSRTTGKRGRGSVPDIGGGGSMSSTGAGAVPDLGAVSGGKRGRGDAPDIGAGGRASREPIFGTVAKGGYPDLSGRGGQGSARGKRDPFRRGVVGMVRAYIGMRPMSKREEAEFDLFVRRAHQAGYEVNTRQVLSWRASIMNGSIEVGSLWDTSVGQGIEGTYGKKGAELDKPENERQRQTYIKKKEERMEKGIRARVRRYIKKRRKR